MSLENIGKTPTEEHNHKVLGCALHYLDQGFSVIPLKHGKRARKVFEKRGEIARGVINKSAEFLHRSGLYFKQDGKE